jgi:hypothetical protein
MCGCFRSNTSVSAFILDNHPEILMANELCAFELDERMNNRLRWCASRPGKGMKQQKRYLRDKGENLSLNYEKFYSDITGNSKPLRFANFANLIHRHKSPTVISVGEKLPAYIDDRPVHENDWVCQKYLKFGPMKVVCCIRDCRDVITSQIQRWHKTVKKPPTSLWKQPDVKGCVTGNRTWYRYMESWTKWKEETNFPCHEIHYGKLESDMDGEAEKLAQFLDVDLIHMKESFQTHFKPSSPWKTFIPNLTEQLPKEWIDMLQLYEFNV